MEAPRPFPFSPKPTCADALQTHTLHSRRLILGWTGAGPGFSTSFSERTSISPCFEVGTKLNTAATPARSTCSPARPCGASGRWNPRRRRSSCCAIRSSARTRTTSTMCAKALSSGRSRRRSVARDAGRLTACRARRWRVGGTTRLGHCPRRRQRGSRKAGPRSRDLPEVAALIRTTTTSPTSCSTTTPAAPPKRPTSSRPAHSQTPSRV